MFRRKMGRVAIWALTVGAVLLAADTSSAQPIGYRVRRAVDIVSGRYVPDVVYYGDYYSPWVYVPGYGYYPMYGYDVPPPAVNGPVGAMYQSFYPPDRPLPQPATLTVRVPADAEVWLQGMRIN